MKFLRLTLVAPGGTLAQLGETSFARGIWEFKPGLRHKKRPHMEASSMLDKSFCAKPNKWVWPTTNIVVTQTHLSRIAQKSLSVLCRVFSHSQIRKLKWAHWVLNAILVKFVKGKKKASPEVASMPAKEMENREKNKD